jgi:hypothetical protein
MPFCLELNGAECTGQRQRHLHLNAGQPRLEKNRLLMVGDPGQLASAQGFFKTVMRCAILGLPKAIRSAKQGSTNGLSGWAYPCAVARAAIGKGETCDGNRSLQTTER